MDKQDSIRGGVAARIRSAYQSLLPAERQVADYVLKYPLRTAGLPIQELAASAGTSKSSVTRFCKHLGLAGFREFQLALAKDSARGVPHVHEAIQSGDAPETVIRKICRANARACQETMEILDPVALQKAARSIYAAERVILLGDGGMSAIIADLYHKLLRSGINCVWDQDRRSQHMLAMLTGPKDTAVGFSLSGSSVTAIKTLEAAKLRGASTIAVTNGLGSPITRIADISLYGASRMASQLTGTIEPRIAQLCIVDSLFMVLVNLDPDRFTANLARTREAIVDDWVEVPQQTPFFKE